MLRIKEGVAIMKRAVLNLRTFKLDLVTSAPLPCLHILVRGEDNGTFIFVLHTLYTPCRCRIQCVVLAAILGPFRGKFFVERQFPPPKNGSF